MFLIYIERFGISVRNSYGKFFIFWINLIFGKTYRTAGFIIWILKFFVFSIKLKLGRIKEYRTVNFFSIMGKIISFFIISLYYTLRKELFDNDNIGIFRTYVFVGICNSYISGIVRTDIY